MKNRNYFNQSKSKGLLMSIFAFAICLVISSSTKAQSKVNLKTLKAEDAAQTITIFGTDLVKFFEDEEILRAFKLRMEESVKAKRNRLCQRPR